MVRQRRCIFQSGVPYIKKESQINTSNEQRKYKGEQNICLSVIYCHHLGLLYIHFIQNTHGYTIMLTRRGHITVKMNFGWCIIVSFMPFGCDVTVKCLFVCWKYLRSTVRLKFVHFLSRNIFYRIHARRFRWM